MNNWYLLAAIPVFGLLVLVHEFGHFITAKWAGIRVEEFGLGFPPRLVGFRRRDQGGWEVIWFGGPRDESAGGGQTPFNTSGGVSTYGAPVSNHTIYSLNLLPIGGFVRMPGENGDMHDEFGRYDAGSFAAKPAGKRIIVLCAGVVMNFILAIVLFTIAYGLGEPTYPAQVGEVAAGSPAAAAGLRPGDRILSVNGQPVKLFDDLGNAVTGAIEADHGRHATVPVTLVVQHEGAAKPVTVVVHARVNPPPGQGAMGITSTSKVVFVTSPVWQAPFKGMVHTVQVTSQFINQIVLIIVGAVKPDLAGPVGIVKITGQVAQTVPDLGWWPILSLTAILSLNLAIINILPFPALDGGRIFLILIEILRGGKRLKPEREGFINFVGMAILLTLMVIITISDVIHWGS
ncbi:MAG TPA: M50 family metallopeptidase [Ktedonobacteraceae bacterium]|jgi:regulator of sigma E protease|nr:M50 family metallopeptidase [Ktedonobacteraceae bacterium]